MSRQFVPAPGSRCVHAAAALFLLAGCDKVSALVGRGGATLSQPLKSGDELVTRTLIEAVAPLWTGSRTGSTSSRLDLKLRCRITGAEADGWASAEAEILEGSMESAAGSRPLQGVGQKLPFKLGSQRRINRPANVPHPTGLELMEIAPPDGRIKKGDQWKVAVKRALLIPQEEIDMDKLFRLEGEDTWGGEPVWRLSVQIVPLKRALGSGAQLELAGTGEVLISRKTGRLMRSTEVLEGRLTD